MKFRPLIPGVAFLLLFVSCDPFAYKHEKINSCAEAISFNNSKNGDYETASQFLDDNFYSHLSGAIISFVKDTMDDIRLEIVMEWEQHDFAKFRPDTIKVDDVKWYSSHFYVSFRGGATSHIAATYEHDYRVASGFHIKYISEPVRSEIINQIIELRITDMSVSTSGVRASTEKKIPCQNLSFSLECLQNI